MPHSHFRFNFKCLKFVFREISDFSNVLNFLLFHILYLALKTTVFTIILFFESAIPNATVWYFKTMLLFGLNILQTDLQNLHTCCVFLFLFLYSKNEQNYNVSLLWWHKLHKLFQMPINKSLCSVKITLHKNFDSNAWHLLQQSDLWMLSQTDFRWKV